MNNSRDLDSRDLMRSQLGHFNWLIENHCPDHAPLRSAFQTFENGELLGMPAYDAGNPDQWAQDYLREFLGRLNCSDMSISLVLRDDTLSKRESDKELISPSYQSHESRYYTDQYGRPVLYVDPSKLSRSGYLARRLTLAVSNQVQLSIQTHNLHSDNDQRHLSYLTAVFLGLSLVLTPNSRADADIKVDDSSFDPIESQILFATTIYWRLKGQKYEHAMTLYGEQYNEKARSILKQACTQLDDFNDEIKALRQNVIEQCQNTPENAVA